ncbi:Panacea domain-containing protein [Methanobrevibacter filiformis]|uniref:Antitoxin SocA-like Panacea domain-containing protein n=1 Tax=Methanobrevibacter filiformis TaxID=55758 RepID=A0A166EVI4_9EURY|nr:Panacea domain-containing protein [Methanobrevibacter filiformis]KZX17060.1 hypothetical protein MBFIL_03780 [Methanobrevibacter filiformis]
MTFNKEKMKQVIHYIVHKCQDKDNFGKTVLYKLMYFSDFNHYEIYETSITDETYIKRENGPVPSSFDKCCNELEEEYKIDNEKKPVLSYYRYHYFSLKDPDINLLSNNERKVIDNVIEKLSSMNARSISDYSHGDKPWRVAEFTKPLDPEFVFYRDDEYSVRVYED